MSEPVTTADLCDRIARTLRDTLAQNVGPLRLPHTFDPPVEVGGGLQLHELHTDHVVVRSPHPVTYVSTTVTIAP